MKNKILTLLTFFFLLSTLYGCKEIEQQREKKLDELVSESSTQENTSSESSTQDNISSETSTQNNTSSETSTQEEESTDLGFEVVSSNFKVDWNSNGNAFQLYEVTSDYYLADFYDRNEQSYVLNSLDQTGNLLETSIVNNMSIIKHYGEHGLLYLMRDNDVYITKKVDENGVVWEKEGYFNQNSVHFPTQDGGYITNLVQYDHEINKSNSYLIKLNSEGNLLWEFGPYDQVSMLKEYKDGGFLFHYAHLETNTYRSHIVRYNAELEQVMDIEILGSFNKKNLIVTEDYIFVYVSINNRERIQCYDLNGNFQSEYFYPHANIRNGLFNFLTYDENVIYFLQREAVFGPTTRRTINRMDSLGNNDTLSVLYNNLKILKRYEDGSILLSHEDPDLHYLKLASDGKVVYDRKMVDSMHKLNFYFFTQYFPKNQGFMYLYHKFNENLLGKVDTNGDTEWEIEIESDCFNFMEGINDDFYLFYYEAEDNVQLAHHNSQGELINNITINGNAETIQNFKVLENGNIVYTLTDFEEEEEYLVILSPTGETLYNQELKGYICDNFGDHKTFFTINDKGEQEQVILKYDAIGFISFQNNYYY